MITFKCRSTGKCSNDKPNVAWTLSSWHAYIRLCKNDRSGYFTSDDKLRGGVSARGATVMHEVSHNINAIGDKKINGNKANDGPKSRDLAKKHPTRASWSAENYARFSSSNPKH